MGSETGHRFGGEWTEEKLRRLKKYLHAYMQIMKERQYFRAAYIDAFAGTGYRHETAGENDESFLFPEWGKEDNQGFLEGSAQIALKVQPPFNRYIFVEKNSKYRAELEELKNRSGELTERVSIHGDDANHFLQDLCRKDWRKSRAVLFLDPYGMQVEWKTLEAIASTRAIDLWLLFPLGIGVNRMIPRSGSITPGWTRRLDTFFGNHEWHDAFFKVEAGEDLFGPTEEMRKTATFESIANYFVERLKTIFPAEGVAENPLPLRNSSGNPLYLLCFAAANPRGAPTAKKIAQDILNP